MTIRPRTNGAATGDAEPASEAAALHIATAYCAVLLSGLFAGFLVTVLVLEFSMRSENAAVYTQVRLIELKHLDDLATALLLPAILAVSILALSTFRHRGVPRWLAGTALLLLAATLVISVSNSVPINTMQQGWSVADPPGDWAEVRDRWQLAHVARTTTSVLAFLVLIAIRPSRRRAPSAA
jgi:Domain of unknown function (DUF1772)